MCHDNEEWYKIWRGIDLLFPNWQEEFDKFWPKHLKVSNIFTLMCSFWAKYILFELKKYSQIIYYDTEEGYKVWKKNWLVKMTWGIWQIFIHQSREESWKIWRGNEEFHQFDLSTPKSLKCTLELAPLTKLYVWVKKNVQRSYVWWHWRLMQNLKENWLVLSKMTWGIWQICIGWNKWIANLTKLFTHV